MTATADNAEPNFPAEVTQIRMGPRLKLLSGPRRGRELIVPACGLILGREGQLSEQLAADPTVSRRHARVYLSDQGQAFIEDLGSVNGTFVNGHRIPGHILLADQDIIKIGNVELRILASSERPVLTTVHDETRLLSEDTDQLLADGRRLLEQGQLDRSQAAFLRASRSSAAAADGHYGLGMVALARGDLVAAEAAFTAALTADPTHNNALYQLGFLWEKQGRRDDALRAYRRILAAQPDHASAKVRHQALSNGLQHQHPPVPGRHDSPHTPAPEPGWPASPPAQEPDRPVEEGQLGVLAYLMSDPTPLSRQAVALIQQLQIETRPRFLAYLGRHPLVLTVLILAAGALLFLGSPLGLLALALIFVIYGAMYIRVACTRIRIWQGRLQIQKGVFHKDLSNYDLWRVRAISLKKTLINRMTGDGTLSFALSPEASTEHRRIRGRKATIVKVPGLTHGSELASLYQDLLNLVFLLRGNPVVKGIIQ
jgi:tetratricopeptide (TPR) repeat protein